MRGESWKRFAGVALVLLLSLVIAPGVATYSGVCISQWRYVRDKEKVINVVSSIVSRLEATKQWPRDVEFYTGQGYIVYSGVKIVPYENVDEFFERNPNCCRVGLDYRIEHIEQTFLRRVTGSVSDFVVVRYQLHFADSKGVAHSQEVLSQTAVDVCGVPVSNDENWIL